MKTNIKTIFKKKPEVSSALSSIKHVSFPEKDLRNWLKGRKQWNNDDWLSLLEDLRKRGYLEYADSDDGRTKICLFLEANRD